MGSQRKGAGSSVDWFPLVFRCRSLGNHQDIGTPLVDSAFVWVGLKRGSGKRRAGEGTRPYGVSRTGNVCSAKPGAEVEPHQRQFLQTQGPVARRESRKATQILRAGRALPTQRGSHRNGGQGKACGRVRTPAPTAYPAPGTFARQSQARKRNRTSGSFCRPRARWPGGNRGKPLKFCAPEGHCPPKGITPVNGVRGKRSYGHEVPIGRVPGGVLVNFSRTSRRSPAQRVRREEEEQGSGRSFRRQAETETSGLCDDEPPWAK